MSFFQAFILGILQGLAEFLPISSSGHLKIGEALFGLEDLSQYLLFDIVCHFGTVLAILCVFASEIKRILTRDWETLGCILLATLVLVPCVGLIRPLKGIMDTPAYLGFFFLATTTFLLLGHRFEKLSSPAHLRRRKWRHALIVGVAQAGALFPGVSRSGMTISAMRVLGWEHANAKKFSFLMAVPAVLGSMVIEGAELLFNEHVVMPEVPLSSYLGGFFSSFVFGTLILLIFPRIPLHTFRYFAWYCLALGIFSILYFNFGV